MRAHLPFMPGSEDRFDVREVLIERCPSNAGLLSDLRHRYRPQPVLGNQCRCGIQGGITHCAPVRGMARASDSDDGGGRRVVRPQEVPRWVKIFGAVGVVLIVLFIALHVSGHGFGPLHAPFHALTGR
jgi:hypothetical protein